MDCTTARDCLARQALAAEPGDRQELIAAQEHVAGCPACASHLARLAQAIASADADELSCAETRAQLDTYSASAGSAPGMERVRSHLARCRSCAAEAAAWAQILAHAQSGTLAEPPTYPVFDLSFLPTPEQIWTQVRAGVRRLVYAIPAALALAGRALVAPPPGLAVSYATVQAPRRGNGRGSGDTLVSLAVEDSQEDMRIALNLSQAGQATWLAVAPTALTSGRPLAGSRIALCDDRGQAQEIKTMRQGEAEARFQAIPPGEYVVRVQRSGKTWELPVNLQR